MINRHNVTVSRCIKNFKKVPTGAPPKMKSSIIGVWGKLPNKQNGKFRLRAEFFNFERSCTGLHCLPLLYQIYKAAIRRTHAYHLLAENASYHVSNGKNRDMLVLCPVHLRCHRIFWAIPHNIVCGALRIFFADSASSNLAIHKVWLRLSSLIRQKISRKSLLPNYAVLPLFLPIEA